MPIETISRKQDSEKKKMRNFCKMSVENFTQQGKHKKKNSLKLLITLALFSFVTHLVKSL